MKKLLKRLFLPLAVIIIGTSFTGAYFSDTVSTTNNQISAGTWASDDLVKINEFSSHSASDWIEIYNGNTQAINLSGYIIEDGFPDTLNLSGTIAGQSYLVFNTGMLNQDGDIIKLKNGSTIIDQVAYGAYDDGNLLDNPTPPAAGESLARTPDGKDTGIDNADFIIDTTPTQGGSNG